MDSGWTNFNMTGYCSSTTQFFLPDIITVPVPVAARSKAQVFGRSPAEIMGSNPTGGMDVCLL